MNQKSKIRCIVTGEQLGISADRFKKLVEKAGGNEDELRRTYICRNAKRMLRDGKSVDQIRKDAGVKGLPKVPQDVLQSFEHVQPKKKVTKLETTTSEVQPETNKNETLINIAEPAMA